MNQCERILRHLYDYNSITSKEAIYEYGIHRLSARISDLEKQGYYFDRVTEKGTNRYGEPTHWTRYSLKEKTHG